VRIDQIKQVFKILLGLLIGLGFVVVLAGLQQTGKSLIALRDVMRELIASQQSAQEDLKASQRSVQEQLKVRHQVIQKELQELRSLLQRGVQDPQPPREVALDVAQAPFKGEQQATLTLIEFSDYQ